MVRNNRNNNDNGGGVYVLPEGSRRTKGSDAQRANIEAAKLVSETVRTTLGPKGMDKMIVSDLGDIVVTNDGVTILNELNITHPIGKMIVDIAKTQESEIGDGTTTAVILAGELMKKAELLLDQDIHPTIIAKGYKLAADKAIELLEKEAEIVDDEESLRKIACTSMTGKGTEDAKHILEKVVVEAINDVENKKDVKLEKAIGESIEKTSLIKGIVIDREKVHNNMPSLVNNAKIALIDEPIEIKSTEMDAKLSISSPEQMQQFLDMEQNMLKKFVDKIISLGATVVICQKGIDELAQHYFAKAGILAVRRTRRSDLIRIAKATKAKIISKVEEATSEYLGSAGVVSQEKIGNNEMIFIKDCKNAKAVTILVKGNTEQIANETQRALEDAIGVCFSVKKDKKVVGGAGAPEIMISKKLKEFANTLTGREQLAVNNFAEALEIVPRTLAENSGIDPIDALTTMKAGKYKWTGINVFTGKTIDSWKENIIEPLKIKTQAISSASEVAMMILRIDDVISAEPAINKQSEPRLDM